MAASSRPKFVMLGKTYVGKSSLVMRLLTDGFREYLQPTQADFYTVKRTMGENAVHFDLWDTAGQERFKSLLPMYTRDATVAVIVFDVNDPLSLEEALIQAKENSKLPILALVANKCDLLTNPLQDPLVQEAQKQADLLNINFFVTSAKSGLGVAKMFDSLALAAARMLAKPGDPLYSKASPSTSAPESTRDTITLNAETQNAPQSQGFKCWSVFNWFGNSAEGKVSNATS